MPKRLFGSVCFAKILCGLKIARFPPATAVPSRFFKVGQSFGEPQHKLARLIYHMVSTRQSYDETICVQNEALNRQRLEARLRKQARDLGLEIIPAKTGAV
jgi:hypothetical protein